MRLVRCSIPMLLSSAFACLAAGGCTGDDSTPPSDNKSDAGSDAGADTGASEAASPDAQGSETGSSTDSGAVGLASIGHIVVIYQENHSFDNLFGSYPGAEGLSAATAMIPQIDGTTGTAFAMLPQVDPNVPTNLANQPFDITQFLATDQKTIDLVHRYYQEQEQINGSKMDSFVTFSDAKGLSMGYYPSSKVPLITLIGSMSDKVTVLDHFFHAAFGGSFLNHQWLVAAASPTFPNAPTGIVATLDATGKLVTDGQVTPDGFVVNTSYSVNAPHPATTAAANLVPNQTGATIGDRLSDAGVDWAWYAGGWNDALAGNADPLFQFHHQPFVFFEKYADGTAAKTAHLKDEADFMAGVAAGQLPPVSFIKPLGANNEHPGYADLATGENHIVSLIQNIVASPLWSDTVIIVTYDENGGFWDHVPPPAVDKWGPGARVPTIVFSPFAKGGVDKTVYDTTAILKLIEKRWDLPSVATRDAAQADISANALKF
jgi:phospholipase C